jgi:LysR family transcriptional regulator for bpeEF and oprC
MTLEQLKILARVVQTGSFTRAAEALGTQKSYVSRVVSHLEAELGVKLLERTTRTLSITETGREVYERAVGILGAVDDTLRVAQQAQGAPRGVLRLTCGVEFGLLAVGGWIEEFLTRFPAASVEAEYTSRVLDIVHEGFDLAVRVGAVEESRLVARRLGELEYGLFACPLYLERHGAPAELANLREHALIMFSGGGQRRGWRLSLEDEHDVQRIEGPARLRVNNAFAVRDAIARSLGIGLLPLLIAHHLHEPRQLVRVLPQWSGETVPVHAVYPSNRYLSPKVRSFIDLALERLPQAHESARRAIICAPVPRKVRARGAR